MLSADSVTRFPVLGMSTTAPTKTKHRSSKEQLGIFQGVIVPTCDVMWSVVIFLRFPAIVGHADELRIELDCALEVGTRIGEPELLDQRPPLDELRVLDSRRPECSFFFPPGF